MASLNRLALGLCLAAAGVRQADAAERRGLQGGSPNEEFLVPAECASWFDGCNTCQVVNGTITSCTQMMCSLPQPPRCLVAVPDCTYWYDGCNDCNIHPNGTIGCTQLACQKPERPRCLATMPSCPSWFDGCNRCKVNDGHIGGCTRRFCHKITQPRCMRSSGCCYSIGFGDEMRPCCLTVHSNRTSRSSCDDVIPAPGGRRGWSAQCPTSAAEAAKWLNGDTQGGSVQEMYP